MKEVAKLDIGGYRIATTIIDVDGSMWVEFSPERFGNRAQWLGPISSVKLSKWLVKQVARMKKHEKNTGIKSKSGE
jgi:hypothetical protein